MGKRKALVLSLIVIVLLGALVIGCTKSTSTPAPTATTAATATAAATTAPATQAVELKYHLPGAPNSTAHVGVYVPWIKELEKQGNGRIKITVYTGGALGKAVDQADLLIKGGADMGSFNSGFTPGRFPLSGIIELPMMTPNIETAIYTFQKLAHKYPQFEAEYPGLKVVTFDTTDPIQLMFNKNPVTKLEDLKGKTIRANSDNGAKQLTAYGASPVFSDVTEIYQLLERGTIDGTMVTLEGVKSFKIAELVKYGTISGMSCAQTVFCWNINSFNNLPADLKTLITTGPLGEKFLTEERIKAYNINTQAGLKDLKTYNAQLTVLNDAEIQRWKDASKGLYDAWIKNNASKGPTQQMFDDMLAFEAEFIKQYPVKILEWYNQAS